MTKHCQDAESPSTLLRRQKLDQILGELNSRLRSLDVAVAEGNLDRAFAQVLASESALRQVQPLLADWPA